MAKTVLLWEKKRNTDLIFKVNIKHRTKIHFTLTTISNMLSKWLAALSASQLETILYYNDVIMGMIASQITSLTIVYSIVYSDEDQRKHQSPPPLYPLYGVW